MAQLLTKAKGALCVLLSLALALGMVGCKPTDFFTEVIITPQSDVVDVNNENMIRINNPDAKQETDSLSALIWTDESKQTEATENLVVWSNEPNSIMTTHRSLFDLSPRFPGILASDGVRVLYDKNADFQYDQDTDDDNDRDDVTATGAGRTGSVSQTATTSGADTAETVTGEDQYQESAENGTDSNSNKGNSDKGDAKGDQGGGSADGGSTAGEDEGEDVSDDPSEEEGRTPQYEGYGGSVKYFDPNDMLADIPEADSVAVIGKQAAVMVQALGGKGAICAMGKFDYNGTDDNNKGKVYYEKTFAEVFATNADEWSGSAYLWDSASSADFSSINAAELVSHCDYDGVVIYDQSVITDINEKLPEDVKRETYGYNISFMPVDFSSLAAIKESAFMVGQVLGNSAKLAEGWSSVGMASNYCDTIDSLTVDLAGARKDSSSVYVSMATDAQDSTKATNGQMTLTDQLVLFADYGQDKFKPLNSVITGIGLHPLRTNNSEVDKFSGALALMCPLGSSWSVEQGGIAAGYWVATGRLVNQMTPSTGTAGAASGNLGGLGSKTVPYLIVCGSSDGTMTSKQVAAKAETSILKYKLDSQVSLYAAFSYQGSLDHLRPSAGGVSSYIGGTVADEGATVSENPLWDRDRVQATVRANPVGCLGSWSGVSFESVLEAAWLAAVYSQAPDSGSPYNPKVDWGNVSVYVGDSDISGTGKTGMEFARSVTDAFYSKFYRCSYTPDFDE